MAMTTLLGRSGVSGSPSDPSGPGGAGARRLPAPVRVRRPMLAIGSVAVVIASVVIFVGIYSGATRQTSVVTVVRPVMQGQPITASALGVGSITVSGDIAPVPVAESALVLGKVAAVALVPGTLLTMADVSDAPVIKPGDAVVGVALKDGQLPAAGLVPGEQVMVVQTETPGTPVNGVVSVGSPSSSSPTPTLSTGQGSAAAQASTGVLVPDALVHDVATPQPAASGSETELVSLEVSSTLAAQVSVAAAADQVSLVLLPQSAGGA